MRRSFSLSFTLIISVSTAGSLRGNAALQSSSLHSKSALIGDINKIAPSVVINEIHYDPDVKTELVEFVELHNFGSIDVNLAGWYFSDGISYQFPAGAILPAGGYVIVAQNPTHIHAKWKRGQAEGLDQIKPTFGRFVIPLTSLFGPFELESKPR